MAIQSASEFEAIINQVLMRIDKALNERGSVPSLEGSIRDFRLIFEAARQPAKLKALRDKLDKVTDALIHDIPDDNGLREQLWDLADYVDYRA